MDRKAWGSLKIGYQLTDHFNGDMMVNQMGIFRQTRCLVEYGGFLKYGSPKPIGFPIENKHFWMMLGVLPWLRKPPCWDASSFLFEIPRLRFAIMELAHEGGLVQAL